MSSVEQLSRTAQLFQMDLGISDPAVVLRELMAPSISLVADADVMNTLAGQVAISTAAMLMARSGQSVYIDAPDAQLIGYQPPMEGRTFHQAIASIGNKLIDDVEVAIGCPRLPPDIAFVFGNGASGMRVRAKRIAFVGWTDWSAELSDCPRQTRWADSGWPIGAMGAAVLVAAEAAKIAGLMLTKLSDCSPHFIELFAPSHGSRLVLAPESTPQIIQLGNFDIISAGAVSNAFLYSLFRLPSIVGNARAFDEDVSDESNRNRNVLLIPEFVGKPKVELFGHFVSGISIDQVARHFSRNDLSSLADRAVVGVDDIPTRWLLAGAQTNWLGVGATSHFESMASVHYSYAACAACLHPHHEEQVGHTPTIAFVSFLAGLIMASDFLRDLAGAEYSVVSRQRYLTAFQTEGEWATPVVPYLNCPAHCQASMAR